MGDKVPLVSLNATRIRRGHAGQPPQGSAYLAYLAYLHNACVLHAARSLHIHINSHIPPCSRGPRGREMWKLNMTMSRSRGPGVLVP